MLDSRDILSPTFEVVTDLGRVVLQVCADTKGQVFLCAEMSGQICAKDLSVILDMIESNPVLSLKMPTLWDMRTFDFATQNTEAFRDSIFALRKFPQRQAVKRAHLVKSEIGFGMMRMFQEAANGFHIEQSEAFYVSYDRGALLQWLSE